MPFVVSGKCEGGRLMWMLYYTLDNALFMYMQSLHLIKNIYRYSTYHSTFITTDHTLYLFCLILQVMHSPSKHLHELRPDITVLDHWA